MTINGQNMPKNYLVPDDPSFFDRKGDPFASSKKNPGKALPAFGSPAKSKTIMIYVLPPSDPYMTSGSKVGFKYDLSTIGYAQFYMQNQKGEFEGNFSLERSMYDLLRSIDDGGLAERRAIVFSKDNVYTGYIDSAAQSGKTVTLILHLLRKNPELPENIQRSDSVELVYLPKDHDLGFNLKKEQWVYNSIANDTSDSKYVRRGSSKGVGSIVGAGAPTGQSNTNVKYSVVKPLFNKKPSDISRGIPRIPEFKLFTERKFKKPKKRKNTSE
jgi:hypothetical protein